MQRWCILLLVVILGGGCNDAASDQRAEQARTAATVSKLRKLGQDMHANQAKNSTETPATRPK
jgi:hypothetical protein